MATQKEAMIWGAVAGVTTVLAETLTIDPASLFKAFDPIAFSGYCVKALVLMALGAIVVRVNRELNIQKAFQLGLMAPALIIGIQSGANLNDAKNELFDVRKQIQQLQSEGSTSGTLSSENSNGQSYFFINNAYAQDHVPKGKHRNVSLPTRFWYGLTGSLEQGWFVIAGSHKNKTDAEKQAKKLKEKGWNVKAGDSFVWGGYYSVLIGSYLSKSEAAAIRDLAIKEGLPKDTYVWRK